MKKTLLAAVALSMGITASAMAATNPFSDVPAGHWAYDSLAKLSKNTSLKILGSQGSWLHVEVVSSKTAGYVFSKYVTFFVISISKYVTTVLHWVTSLCYNNVKIAIEDD